MSQTQKCFCYLPFQPRTLIRNNNNVSDGKQPCLYLLSWHFFLQLSQRQQILSLKKKKNVSNVLLSIQAEQRACLHFCLLIITEVLIVAHSRSHTRRYLYWIFCYCRNGLILFYKLIVGQFQNEFLAPLVRGV